MARCHRVDIGDTELYVEELGDPDAPAVVFGHSLLCDGRMFADQVTDLARDHRVLNLDFRAHGRSGVPRHPWTMQDQGRDYVRVMDALGVDRALVVGLSMGGMAAFHLALSHPERLWGLVLLDTSADREERSKRARYGALAWSARLLGFRPWLLAQASGVMFGETFRRSSPDVVQLWEERFGGLNRSGAQRAVQMVSSRPSVRRRLAEIRTPTLVVCGAEDVACPPRYARAIAAEIAGAELEILPATGHLATIERPQETTELIRRFSERLRETST